MTKKPTQDAVLERGPFRAVTIPNGPEVPSRFIYQCDDSGLVIEGRRRFETAPRLILAGFAGLFFCALRYEPWGPAKAYFLIFSCVAALSTLIKFWSRTTLTIRGDQCVIAYRGLFHTKWLRGDLRTLDIVDIVDGATPLNAPLVRKRPKGKDTLETVGLQLSLGGSQAVIFRAVPRSELEWVAEQVRDWKVKHLIDPDLEGPLRPARDT